MRRNLIQAVAVIMLLVSKAAYAQEATIELQAETQVQEAMRLARISVLLRELAKAQAIEIDQTGKIVVKQSVREQLLNKQILTTAIGVRGGLCD
jgi:hypothetical protein